MSDSAPTSADYELQSAHPEKPDGLRVPLLLVFQETFLMMTRYFIILYPFIFFYLIGPNLLLPLFRNTPDFTQWAWWAILLGVPAISYLLKAGWINLLFQCVQEWQFLKTQFKNDGHDKVVLNHAPFAVLKHFIPGVGEYGVSFLAGNVIWLILAALPIVLVTWLAYTQVGVPTTFTKVSAIINAGQTLTDAQLQTMAAAIPEGEQNQISQWILYLLMGVGASMFFNFMTFFWQQYLIIKRCNPFRAMLLSMQHLVRYPLHSVAIILAFTGISTLAVFTSLIPTIGSFIGTFLLILLMIYSGLFNFLYLDYLDVKQDLA